MTTAKVIKVRENIKKGYESRGGFLYKHGLIFENDPIEYEYHSKSESCKVQPGDVKTFDITEDAQKNKKVKFVDAPPGQAVQVSPQTSGFSPAPLQGNHTVSSKQDNWLSVFRSLCIAKQNAPALDLEVLITKTNEIVDKLPA